MALPPTWKVPPSPAVMLHHAVPHAVVPQLLRCTIAPFVPAASIEVRALHDAHCCVDTITVSGDAADAVAIAAQFPHLTMLLLWKTGVDAAALSAVTTLPKGFRSLGLRGCWNVDAAALVHVGALPQLTGLDLSQNKSIDAGGIVHLKELTNLQTLNLTGCPNVDSGALAHVAALAELRILILSSCSGVDAAGLEHVGRLLKLEELALSRCAGVDTAGLRCIAALPQLRTIHLVRCPNIDDGALSLLSGVPSIIC